MCGRIRLFFLLPIIFHNVNALASDNCVEIAFVELVNSFQYDSIIEDHQRGLLEVPEENHHCKVHLHFQLACAYQLGRNFTRANEHIVKADSTLQKSSLKDDSLQAEIWRQKGLIYGYTGKLQSSLNYFYRSIKLKQVVHGKEDLSLAKTFNQLGEVYLYDLGEYSLAHKYLQKSLGIYLKKENVNQYDLAISYYNNSFVAYQKMNSSCHYPMPKKDWNSLKSIPSVPRRRKSCF